MWLSIFVFISTLFWPQLLDKELLLVTLATSFILLLMPKLRVLAIIPITVLYFTLYATLTLTGQFPPVTQQNNKGSLAVLVDGQDHNIVVQVVSLISENNRGYFNAKLIAFDTDHLNYSPLIEMRWYKPNVSLQAGQLHRFVARFKPVYGRANPGGFDRQKWAYSEHIGYQATIKKHIDIIDKNNTLRASFYQQVVSVTDGLSYQGLLLALSFADKSLIPTEVKQRIRNLGISHLFAISGLHIGLLFSAFYLLVQCISKRLLPADKMGWFSLRLINITALTGAWGYAYLAGFSLPTQRAFLMLLVAVLVLSLKRKCAKADVLLVVLFAVLIWDPLAVMSLSLWLSFGAVIIILGLMWAFPNIISYQQDSTDTPFIHKVVNYVKLLCFLQIGLTLLMLPLQLLSFSALSLVGVLVNLVAIPLFSLLLIPLVLLAAFMTLIYPALAQLIFTFCNQLITYFLSISTWFSDSYYWFSVSQERVVLMGAALCLLLFLVHFQTPLQRKMSYLFTVIALGLLLVIPAPEEKGWFVEVLDIGQGLSVIVRNEGETLLYDTGARYPSGFNMVDAEIAPYLVTLGIKKLDHLVISHSDIDHAGGADRIAAHLPIDKRWAGEPLQSPYVFQPCRQGQHWSLGRLKVEALAPFRLTANNNNNSCVLRISDATTVLLLTGDIEKKQEKILVAQFGKQLNSDILIAPHHGSRHSSSTAFIEAVDPQWVVFSAGFMNHWGFPADEVVNRYQKQSVKMVNSGQSGLIRFQITAQAIKMKTFREDLAPYWYHHSLTP